jgi:hypothetical protein
MGVLKTNEHLSRPHLLHEVDDLALRVEGLRGGGQPQRLAVDRADDRDLDQPGAIMSLSANIYLNVLGNPCNCMYL